MSEFSVNSFCLLYVAILTIFLKNTHTTLCFQRGQHKNCVPWFKFDLPSKSRQKRSKRSPYIMRTSYEYGKLFEKITYIADMYTSIWELEKRKRKQNLNITPLLISFSFNWGTVAIWIEGERIGLEISGKSAPWQLVWNNEFPGSNRGSKEAIVIGVNKLNFFLPCVLPMNWLHIAGWDVGDLHRQRISESPQKKNRRKNVFL